jgi:MFS family permease
MYVAESSRAVLEQRRASPPASGRRHVPRVVVMLGLTSLFTDVSAEMVATILPVYAVFVLGASPIAYGMLDGLYQGASALIRLGSGVVADRGGHKRVAVAGYGLSAFTRVGLIFGAGTVPGLAALIFADRTGKGIRTAPRDAMISLATPREQLGAAFGVHRALDTAGALLGPLVAVGVLLLAPQRYDAVFVVSLAFALIGLAILVLFVRHPRPATAPAAAAPAPRAAAERASLRAAWGLLRERRFRLLTIAAGALGLVTISDGFIYLGIQRQTDLQPALLPLLFVGTSLVFMLLAIPVGRLADRIGRAPVLLAGYALLAVVYLSLLLPTPGIAVIALYLAALGAYYAATDGVLAAMAGALLPVHLRATGLGLLVAVVSLAKLVGSVAFGALWTLAGFQDAVGCFITMLTLVGLGAAACLLSGPRRSRA